MLCQQFSSDRREDIINLLKMWSQKTLNFCLFCVGGGEGVAKGIFVAVFNTGGGVPKEVPLTTNSFKLGISFKVYFKNSFPFDDWMKVEINQIFIVSVFII